MHVVTRESAEQAAHVAARLVLQVLQAKPDAVLGLATGRTMEAVYAELGRLHRHEALDFGSCRSFNLDEYIGLETGDTRSFRHFMHQHFARVVNIAPSRMHLPADDADAYERSILASGGIDLQLLGIGDNGHIGFNEPGTPFTARTHVTTLTASTRRQNAAMFGSVEDVPTRAITMGIGTILEARKIVLLATGNAKAAILAKALRGPATKAVPCSALQLHRDCTVVADDAATKTLGLCPRPHQDRAGPGPG